MVSRLCVVKPVTASTPVETRVALHVLDDERLRLHSTVANATGPPGLGARAVSRGENQPPRLRWILGRFVK
jgi:hypothetical protein